MRGRRLSLTTRAWRWLCLLVSVAPFAGAQRLPTESLGDQLVHETWTKGLPSPAVRQVLQGLDGYLYLATHGGLVRFDGVTFSVFRTPPVMMPDSLPDNYLNGIAQARDGTIWLATMHQGVVAYKNGVFRTFRINPLNEDNEVSAVFEDAQGTIWAGTRAGVMRREGDHFVLVPSLANVSTRAIGEDATGAIWVGIDGGLLVLRDDGVQRVSLPLYGSSRVQSILRSRDGTMWIGTSDGLIHADRVNGKSLHAVKLYTLKDGLHSAYITSVAEHEDGSVWVGTLGGGVARLDANGRFRSLRSAEGLADNNVAHVFIDRDGSIWAGTDDGLTRLRVPLLSMWRSSEVWSSTLLWSVNALPDGTVWVGTGGDGAVRIARDGRTRAFTTADGLPSDVVLTSLRRRDGSLWVGTKAGLARLDGQRFVDQTAALGLPPVGIRTLYEDNRGTLWVGSDSALSRGTPRGQAVLRHGKRTLSGRVYTMVEDGNHRLLVASGTLSYVAGDSLAVFVSASGDTVPQAMDLYADTAGIWVSSYSRGLALLRGDSLRFFPPQRTGIFAQALRILDDGRGALWLSSDAGIQRVRKLELLAYLADTTRRVASRIFTKFDGLRSQDFSKSGSTSGSRSSDGRLWLPTTGGLVVLDPASIRVDTKVPQVFVEDVAADGRSQRLAPRVSLPRGTRRVQIAFTSTQLAVPSRVRLYYKLDGIDPEWREANALDRTATYEDLPRGTFRFLVRAANPDGYESAAPAEVAIVSRPALWRNVWFWGLLTVLVGMAGTLGYRWRVGQLRSHAVMLQRLVDERTESLAARERLEHQLLHAQKLESVGRLAGGVAHDLNNLLTAILGHTELALAEPDVPEQLRADLGEVRTVSMRAANLTKQLLAFARKQVVQPKLLQLGDLAANIDTLVRRLLPENITFAILRSEGGWLVRADPSQIEQVVINLAVNARDAMPQGGRLTLRTRAVSADAAFVADHPQFAPGDYVLLEIEDTGIGMSRDVQSHLFEPFFTTKETGKGTGLGLATTFGIVTQSGGHILVESKEGAGSTFRVYLPRAAGDIAADGASVPAKMPRGTERLLLVEDERAVRDVAERTLRSLGYVVNTASDGVEALEVLEAMHGGVQLVLTDMRMPRLGGLELADAVRERWPGLRVVCMSGHSEALLANDGARAALVLQKPFTAAELAACVRTTLDSAVT